MEIPARGDYDVFLIFTCCSPFNNFIVWFSFFFQGLHKTKIFVSKIIKVLIRKNSRLALFTFTSGCYCCLVLAWPPFPVKHGANSIEALPGGLFIIHEGKTACERCGILCYPLFGLLLKKIREYVSFFTNSTTHIGKNSSKFEQRNGWVSSFENRIVLLGLQKYFVTLLRFLACIAWTTALERQWICLQHFFVYVNFI